MDQVSVPVGKVGVITASTEDAHGSPTGETFASPPVWSVDKSEIASIQASPDGLSAVLTPVAPGVVNVSVVGNVASNPNPISGTLAVPITDVSTQIALSLALQ